MSSNTHTASELVDLGKYVPTLLNPNLNDDLSYAKSLDEFSVLAERFGFRVTHDLALQLGHYTLSLRDANRYNHAIQHLRSTAISIERALNNEALATSVIVSSVVPPPELLTLGCPQAYQSALRDDVVTCLKAELNRPAVVTAWALGFDMVRHWIYRDPARLKALNSQLKSATVLRFEDFFDIGERRVLKACCDSKDAPLNDFTDKTYRVLEGLLDERNNFAHANFELASTTTAKAYVEKIVRVVTGPPFKF